MTTTNFKTHLHSLIQLQRTAHTKEGVPDAATRTDRLRRAADMLAQASDAIAAAVSEDFGYRSPEETRFETFGAVNAFRHGATRVENWMRPAQHPALAADAEAHVEYIPLGVIGVVGPWNYPIMCVFGPLAGILAAGNRAIIKPSELTPRTSALLARLISETFHPTEVAMVHGEAAEGALFSAAPFDHLMFTGSTAVGRHVMRAAAENLTPVTLELGGKSPVIVDDTYNLAEAAQRVMAVKLRSAGQICLAPDYALVPAGSEREFAEQCVAAARRMYPDGLDSVDYTSIINDAHFARLERLVVDASARDAEVLNVFKHARSASVRRMMPILILNPPRDTPVMRDEIFGPILPILGYRSMDDALETVRSGSRPLALYYFGADDERVRHVLDGTASGGVTINDVMTHMFVEDLPYGGIGASGMGTYRGEAGFRTFSHARAIYRQTEAKEAVALLHPPYGDPFRKFLSAALAGQPKWGAETLWSTLPRHITNTPSRAGNDMWSRNELTERLNLKWPILQAPMGSITTPALAAAVSNAGGLGALGIWGFSAEDTERRIAGFRQQSAGSLNVNYPLWPEPKVTGEASEAMRKRLQPHYDAHGLGPTPQPRGTASEVGSEQLAMLLRLRPEVVSFHFGLPPSEVMRAVKGAGIFVICSATTVAEARTLEDLGVDAVIAQGTEAGGHRGTFTGVDMTMQAGLFALLPQVVDAVKVPVIAAGGVADSRQVAAAFMLGASAVQMGTAFLRCEEANVPDAYRAAVRDASDANTVATDMITGRPARFIRNKLVDDLISSGLEAVSFPAQMSLTAPLGATGDREMTALFAGQSAALAKDTDAASFVESLGQETTRRLRTLPKLAGDEPKRQLPKNAAK